MKLNGKQKDSCVAANISTLSNKCCPGSIIKSICYRRILNSHVDFTSEFIIEVENNSIGIGASPIGETLSIYEDRKIKITPKNIINKIKEDGYIGKHLTQRIFDQYLNKNIKTFGRNNAFSLSLAFYKATRIEVPVLNQLIKPKVDLLTPKICFNILNGGAHAYTNPVLSDFPEYLLVANSNNIEEVIHDHNEIQSVVKEKLLKRPQKIIAGNPVNLFNTVDNRECIDFLLGIRDSLGLTKKFELMIDASAGDLYFKNKYHFEITTKSIFSIEELYDYWMNIVKQYRLSFLEDPFAEKDKAAWHRLTTSQNLCKIIGDNFYCSEEKKIAQNAMRQYSHGVIIKPNQSGTVTAVCRAIEAAKRNNLIIITSHRSISTEETFISTLTCIGEVPYIKIGPLYTDYSAVIRLNEIIRITS